MICTCCGHEFEEDEGRLACSSCLAKNACGLVRCPHCGYECTREPGTFHKLRLFFMKKLRQLLPHAPCENNGSGSLLPTLLDLQKGESAIIERFQETGHVRKFLSLGILPGTHITVLKQFPAVVLRVGYSEFAFDRNLAGTVLIRRISDTV